jgi:hypothetical protein
MQPHAAPRREGLRDCLNIAEGKACVLHPDFTAEDILFVKNRGGMVVFGDDCSRQDLGHLCSKMWCLSADIILA